MSISIIRDRVQVEILRDTSAVARVSFGVPLFIGTTEITSPAPLRVASYSNISEVEAVYATTDPEYKAALAFFSQQPQPRQLVIGFKASGETYVQALTAIRAINDTWFCVAIAANNIDTADATDLADAVSALPGLRQVWFRSDAAGVLDGSSTTDIAAVLKAGNYDQARVVYHSLAATAFPEMAQLGRVLPIPESRTTGPGSAAWHLQPIVGIPGDNFTQTQINVMDARDGTGKNVEYFINVAGDVRSMGGKMAGGEWGDVMHGLAWLGTRMSEDVFELLARAGNRREKIPYTDEGISRIQGVVTDRLQRGVDIGLLVELERDAVKTPLREETDFGDRVNRILRDVTFEANLAGAIKFTNIRGVVTA
jgi:hypothetical protein